MHIEPVDPRSKASAPVVLVYPYGIVVDQDGHRFFDEGSGLVHETWEHFARDIHFARPNHIAYAILDSRLFDIEGYERAVRSDVPPYQSDTLEGLAAQIGIPARNLKATVDAFNAAATGDMSRFDASRCDGLAAASELKPPKSNWARPINTPPYLAYPLVGGVAYTFGGLATSERAEVLGAQGPIPGLYAAGETTGHFYGTAPNAVAVLPRVGVRTNCGTRGRRPCRRDRNKALRSGIDQQGDLAWLQKTTAPSSATSPKCRGANFPIISAARCRSRW